MGFSGGSSEILDGSITAEKLNPNVFVLTDELIMKLALNVLINSASASALNDYDEMFLDRFSDSDGYDGTIDTGNTTAEFKTDKYSNNVSVVGGTEATEYSTTSNYPTYVTLYDFTGINQKVSKVVNEIKCPTGGTAYCDVVFYYDDVTDSTVNNSAQTDTYVEKTYTNPFPDKIVTHIEINLCDSGSPTAYTQNNVWHKFLPSNKIIQTNAQTIDADPIAHQIYCHNTLAGSGSITYDISFDGGSTWVTDQAVNTKNISVHAGSSMIVKLNLNGTGAGNTAEAEDYAVMLDY